MSKRWHSPRYRRKVLRLERDTRAFTTLFVRDLMRELARIIALRVAHEVLSGSVPGVRLPT